MINETTAIAEAIIEYDKLFNILMIAYFGEETEIIRYFNMWKHEFYEEKLKTYTIGDTEHPLRIEIFDELHDMITILKNTIKKLDEKYGRNTNLIQSPITEKKRKKKRKKNPLPTRRLGYIGVGPWHVHDQSIDTGTDVGGDAGGGE